MFFENYVYFQKKGKKYFVFQNHKLTNQSSEFKTPALNPTALTIPRTTDARRETTAALMLDDPYVKLFAVSDVGVVHMPLVARRLLVLQRHVLRHDRADL